MASRAAQPGVRRRPGRLAAWRQLPAPPERAAREDDSGTAENGPRSCPQLCPEPYGFALLGQVIFADDYRGRAVTFRAEVRAEGVAERAELHLQVAAEGHP